MPITKPKPRSKPANRSAVAMAAPGAKPLTLKLGYDMIFDCPAAAGTPIVFMLNVHPEVADRLDAPEEIQTEPKVPIEYFTDTFGNPCARVLAPQGTLRVWLETTYRDTYALEPQPAPEAKQHRADELPTDVLPYLLGSRYCEVDRLGAIAWDLFGKLPNGGERVLAINRWVFEHVRFGYKLTRPNKTALDTYWERTGVCRDMMHLAITFCRAMNIPARYATGYLGDIDADPDPTPMDFSAFYEVYVDGKWWPMDARHGKPRVGRVLMARGRDAADCALITSFGWHKLTKFVVVTDEVLEAAALPTPVQAASQPSYARAA